jgi:PAS domain S-box-containing protein
MGNPIDPAALLEALNDAVVACDDKGAIVVWNAAAERIFGFSKAEALGASLDIIIPERLRGRHWEGYDKTMQTGHTKYAHDTLRVPAIDKAGRALSIAFTVAMLLKDGKPTTVMSAIRDETQRFADERALKKRLVELETAVRQGTAS